MAPTPTLGGSMKFKNVRLVVLAALSASFALLWALPANAHPATKKVTTVNVTAGKPTEFGFTLSVKKVAHGPVTFKVTNGGALPHDFKVCSSNAGGTASVCAGKGTKQITAGSSAPLTITFTKPGSYEYLCTV